MRKRHTRPPQTVCRPLAFPVYVLMTIDTQDALPLPMLLQRESQAWMHCECTEAESLAALRIHKAIRRAHPNWWPMIRGMAVLRLDTLEELRGLAAQTTPCPDGVCYGLQYRERTDEWTAQFVRWEQMEQSPGIKIA